MNDASGATPGHDPNTPARLRRLWAHAHQRRLRARAERFNNAENLAAWLGQAAQREADGRPPSPELTAWIARARIRVGELDEELSVVDDELRGLDAALRRLDEALDEQLSALGERSPPSDLAPLPDPYPGF